MTESKVIEERVHLSNGEISIKKYLIGNFLGKGTTVASVGGFAKCYQAK
jgi:hypothetical protein